MRCELTEGELKAKVQLAVALMKVDAYRASLLDLMDTAMNRPDEIEAEGQFVLDMLEALQESVAELAELEALYVTS